MNYKEYYQKNIEKERQRGKDWYARQDKKALYERRKARQLELGHSTWYDRPERCIKYYQRNATKSGLEFQLTLEDFKTFWQKPCFYCGSSIETIGLDRVDSSKGYLLTNIVACCKRCNWMKNTLGQQEFIQHCMRIADHARASTDSSA